jgi:hypothetical protein
MKVVFFLPCLIIIGARQLYRSAMAKVEGVGND